MMTLTRMMPSCLLLGGGYLNFEPVLPEVVPYLSIQYTAPTWGTADINDLMTLNGSV